MPLHARPGQHSSSQVCMHASYSKESTRLCVALLQVSGRDELCAPPPQGACVLHLVISSVRGQAGDRPRYAPLMVRRHSAPARACSLMRAAAHTLVRKRHLDRVHTPAVLSTSTRCQKTCLALQCPVREAQPRLITFNKACACVLLPHPLPPGPASTGASPTRSAGARRCLRPSRPTTYARACTGRWTSCDPGTSDVWSCCCVV